MSESKEQSKYLSQKRVADLVIQFLRLIKKYELWKDPSAVAECKKRGIDLEKLARVDLTKIGRNGV